MSATVTYEAHPLAALIPVMSDDEYTRLRNDVAANGLLDAIVLHEGKVLDGRHRLRACEDTATEPSFVEYDGNSPAQFVLSHNLHRRHLSVSQRAMLATDFMPYLAGEAKARQLANLRQGESPPPSVSFETNGTGRSRELAAEEFGVGHASIGRAKHVIDNDLELAQQVRDGEITVTAAHDFLKTKTNGKTTKPETGAARPAVIRRVAEQVEGLGHAISTLNLTKSCERMTEDERTQALDSCKAGLKALNAMAKALGR